jgi:hypothetical protein
MEAAADGVQAPAAPDHSGNRLARAVEIVMDPVRHTAAPGQFAIRQDQMNLILAFSACSLAITPAAQDGPTTTLTEAQRRAKSLYQRLGQRGCNCLFVCACP